MVHTWVFRYLKEMTMEEAAALAATNLDEFHVESIVNHESERKDPKKWKGFAGLDMSQKMILLAEMECRQGLGDWIIIAKPILILV